MMKKIFHLFLVWLTVSYCSSPNLKKNETNPVSQEINQLESQLQQNLSMDQKSDLYVKLASLYLRANNFNKAVQLLKSAEEIKKGKNIPHVNHYYGSAYYGTMDYKTAISYLKKSESTDKGFAEIERKILLVKSYFEEKDYGRGLGVLGQLAKDRNYVKDEFYYRKAAEGFYQIREYHKSRNVIQQGFAKFPEDKVLMEISRKIDLITQADY